MKSLSFTHTHAHNSVQRRQTSSQNRRKILSPSDMDTNRAEALKLRRLDKIRRIANEIRSID